jgi:chromosome segregation ATPase
MTVFDDTDFIDRELQASQAQRPAAGTTASSAAAARPPTREELQTKLTETQTRITELRQQQEELERQRSTLAETQRRRQELAVGRVEMTQNLTRGVALLEKAEFAARRDAEQMARTLEALRDAAAKVAAISEESWTQENLETELSRALTAVENARMEWNSARLKWLVLNVEGAADESARPQTASEEDWLGRRSLGELCKLGLALTWPLALVGLVVMGLLTIVLLRH